MLYVIVATELVNAYDGGYTEVVTVAPKREALSLANFSVAVQDFFGSVNRKDELLEIAHAVAEWQLQRRLQ